MAARKISSGTGGAKPISSGTKQPEALTIAQKQHYDEHGYLVIPNRIPDHYIQAIRAEIERFVDEARGLTQSNERLDLEDSHTPESPRLRRVKLPQKLSPIIDELMRSDHILGPVRDLIGPSIRLHTSKLNMKAAGYGAVVEWHQDWAFYPHTNDDVLAVGVCIDDMAEENGPLMVFPGSHKGPVLDHHHDGYFAGAVDLQANGLDLKDAVPLIGPAGSISIHHARILHGSAPNNSTRDRRLLFYEVSAADAWPLAYLANNYQDLASYDAALLSGKPTISPRLKDCPVRLPEPPPPTVGSIYEIQKARGANNFASQEDR